MPKQRSTPAQIALVYVPCGSEDEAVTIARTLLRERLIACGNICRSRSLYMWKGNLADEEEHMLLCKTAQSRVEAVERRVRELHSYEVPCILRIEPANVNYDYASWVAGEVLGIAVPPTGKIAQEAASPVVSQAPQEVS